MAGRRVLASAGRRSDTFGHLLDLVHDLDVVLVDAVEHGFVHFHQVEEAAVAAHGGGLAAYRRSSSSAQLPTARTAHRRRGV